VTQPIALTAIVYAFMLAETWRARRNERAQRARGAIEPRGDVHAVMQWAYPLSFAAMIAEGLLRGAPSRAAVAGGVATFAASKALKWWAIAALGPAWTFRVLVVPGAPLVRRGPYRIIRHPNYLAVCGELAGTALATHALVSGPLALAGFGALMLKRIAVEDRALSALPTTRRT
jgi:methyltransferase